MTRRARCLNGVRGRVGGVIGLLLATMVSGCGVKFPGKPDPNLRPRTPSQVVDFAGLFQKNCSGCHGAEGKMGVAPPLNDPLFLAIVPKEVLRQVVSAGREGTMMPAFVQAEGGHLTIEQVDIIVNGLLAKWSKTGAEAPDIKDVPPYLAPDGSTDAKAQGNVESGKKVFAEACAKCHGAEGKGGDPGGPLRVPAFLALTSDQLLRRIVITGRPDLGMPNFARKDSRPNARPLSSQDVADLVALLSSWRVPVTQSGP